MWRSHSTECASGPCLRLQGKPALGLLTRAQLMHPAFGHMIGGLDAVCSGILPSPNYTHPPTHPPNPLEQKPLEVVIAG